MTNRYCNLDGTAIIKDSFTQINDGFAAVQTDIDGVPQGLYRQAIINGNFDVWQRGTSFGSGTNYTADRWITFNFTGTVTQQAFTVGQTAVPNEPTYYLNITATSAAAFSRIEQRIENVRSFAGKKVTVSFWAKSSISSPLSAIEFIQNFGSGGSNQISVVTALSTALSSTWKKFSFTVSVPSISGKTIGANSYLSVAFYGAYGTAATYNIDIAQVQLNSGDVVLPFQPRSFSEELSLCQRYYEKSYDYGTTPGTATTSGRDTTLTGNNVSSSYIIKTTSFKVSKRIAPTVNYWDTAGNSSKITTLDNVTTATNNITPGVPPSNINNQEFIIGHTGTGFAGFQFHWSADAEL